MTERLVEHVSSGPYRAADLSVPHPTSLPSMSLQQLEQWSRYMAAQSLSGPVTREMALFGAEQAAAGMTYELTHEQLVLDRPAASPTPAVPVEFSADDYAAQVEAARTRVAAAFGFQL